MMHAADQEVLFLRQALTLGVAPLGVGVDGPRGTGPPAAAVRLPRRRTRREGPHARQLRFEKIGQLRHSVRFH